MVHHSFLSHTGVIVERTFDHLRQRPIGCQQFGKFSTNRIEQTSRRVRVVEHGGESAGEFFAGVLLRAQTQMARL
jgi:hypothetical protein